jgi:hypothetical protein
MPLDLLPDDHDSLDPSYLLTPSHVNALSMAHLKQHFESRNVIATANTLPSMRSQLKAFIALIREEQLQEQALHSIEDEGKEVKGLGRWNIKGNEERFCSTIYRRHMFRLGKTHVFFSCADCIVMEPLELSGTAALHTINGCEAHTSIPVLQNTGNPRPSEETVEY